eukprot:10551720-Ditylum_brightwellii.AAC.1
MEGNSIVMASSTPALSAITIRYSPYGDSMDYSTVLEMVPYESTPSMLQKLLFHLDLSSSNKSSQFYIAHGSKLSAQNI